MTDQLSEYHLAGGLIATHAAQIADALARLPDTKVRLTDEVEITNDAFELSIYPSNLAGEFLAGGNLHLSHEASRTLVTQIAKLLEEGGVMFELELSPEDGGDDETFRHPRYHELTAARETPMAAAPNQGVKSTWTVDSGNVIVQERLRSGTADEVRRGTRHGDAVLVTLTGKHTEPHERLRARLALSFEGIAALLYLGPTEPGAPYVDVLVERLPPGRPIAELAPLAEPVVARLGAEIAQALARVHASGEIVDGMRPELVYVDETGRFTALVPRGHAFIASAPIARGMRSYYVPYMAPEQLSSSTADARSDVFALCATLWFAATGQHPFGDPDQISELASRLLTGSTNAWPGSRELGDALARGLTADPGARPTTAELATALSRVA